MTAIATSLPRVDQHSDPGAGSSTTASTTADTSSALPVLASDVLLQGQAAVLIEHLGQHYRLQATRQGKLILTK
jgi:hemin uptake protein HemP